MNRLRLIVSACLIVLSVPAAAVLGTAGVHVDDATADSGALAASIPSVTHPVYAPSVRHEMAVPFHVGVSTPLFVVGMILSGLVGRTHRRIGDVGDRWRRLLVGAPPAVA